MTAVFSYSFTSLSFISNLSAQQVQSSCLRFCKEVLNVMLRNLVDLRETPSVLMFCLILYLHKNVYILFCFTRAWA